MAKVKLSQEDQVYCLAVAAEEEAANPHLCGPDGKMTVCQLFDNDRLADATDENGDELDDDVDLLGIDFGFMNRRFE